MTENLWIVGPKTLTSSDTNVENNFELTASDSSHWCLTSSASCIDQTLVHDTMRADYGSYYNWYTATAGSGTYSMSSGEAEYSICPKGWHLPSSGSSGDFVTLYNQYNSYSKLGSTPVSFVLSGFRYGNDNRNWGVNGYLWSNTTYNNGESYTFRFDSQETTPAYRAFDDNWEGSSVRCLAQ